MWRVILDRAEGPGLPALHCLSCRAQKFLISALHYPPPALVPTLDVEQAHRRAHPCTCDHTTSESPEPTTCRPNRRTDDLSRFSAVCAQRPRQGGLVVSHQIHMRTCPLIQKASIDEVVPVRIFDLHVLRLNVKCAVDRCRKVRKTQGVFTGRNSVQEKFQIVCT